MIRTLAEPNLTAISGETANFLAGGEFPIPNGCRCDDHANRRRSASTQIEFKKFGISLAFTPVVLSEGRISLKVMTEVSELSTEGAITLQFRAPSNRSTVPSIKRRRAETTVEIPSGGSLALAGMIQEQTKQQINGLPGLMQLPILGALFKSRDYLNRQTELMILVYALYRAPGGAEGSVASGRRLRRRVGSIEPYYSAASTGSTASPARSIRTRAYRGKYGFILD